MVIVDDDGVDDDFLAVSRLLPSLSTSVVSSSDMITMAFDSLSSGDFVCSGSSTTGTSPISEIFCSTTGLSDRFFCEVFFFTSD